MDKTAIITVKVFSKNEKHDIEVPLDITANDLIIALNEAFQLHMNVADQESCFLSTDSPIAFLKGNKMLYEYGIRNGTVINITQEKGR